MNIFSIDTSSPTASVALFQTDGVQIREELPGRDRLSAELLPAVERLLKKQGLTLRHIDLFAAVTGPGFFTGIRIGLTLLKGFCFRESVPLVGVNGLETLAHTCSSREEMIVALIDARRAEVYRGVYRGSGEGLWEVSAPSLVHHQRIFSGLDFSAGSGVLVGSGATAYRDQILGVDPRIRLLPGPGTLALEAAKLALKKFRQGCYLRDAGDLLPLYIRPSDAETG